MGIWRRGALEAGMMKATSTAFVGALLVCACRDRTSPVGPAPVASVELSLHAASLARDSILQLSATVRDSSGALLSGRQMSWSSSNASVASVSASGLVLGVQPGTATVMAASEGKRDSAVISVMSAAVSIEFRSVSVGGDFACGIAVDSNAYCWGANLYGQLGFFNGRNLEGVNSPALSPGRADGGLRFTSVSAGGQTACGITSAGGGYCWGGNYYGQMGSGTTDDAIAPVAINPDPGLGLIATGFEYVCALTASGLAYCWGSNAAGQLGIGAASPSTCSTPAVACSRSPVSVVGGMSFKSISSGDSHTCGITTASRTYCWGSNTFGNFTPLDSSIIAAPLPVDTTHSLRGIAVGRAHACAMDSSGGAWCWGSDFAGQLGIGYAGSPQPGAARCRGDTSTFAVTCYPTPQPVTGGHTFVALSAGARHTCGLDESGNIYCWGDDGYSQLGSGSAGDESCRYSATSVTPCRTAPTLVPSTVKFSAVAAGSTQTCAVDVAGGAWCWGFGYLGDGRDAQVSPTPVRVVGFVTMR
jgi:alpha-tubulin suppressor-like RCC1 family protein